MKTEINTLNNREALTKKFNEVREFSEILCKPLSIEDYVVQSMADVSPAKWHLAHTTWFFEAFILNKFLPEYRSIHPQYSYLFNSYYVKMGERFSRPRRGLLSRPTVAEVYKYRDYVTKLMNDLLSSEDEKNFLELTQLVEIGINHEQQHQELILTDIKHVLYQNPLRIIYKKKNADPSEEIPPLEWVNFHEGIYEAGSRGNEFAYDNELPRHQVFINSFSAASRLVTCGEYLEFINDEGYAQNGLWLSDGIATVEIEQWKAPLYWEKIDNEWYIYKLTGFEKINPAEPVTNVSFYEADAYARWKNARLLTEFEWEAASENIPVDGNFADEMNFHPVPLEQNSIGKMHQMFGDVWEWTGSSYLPYPGFKTAEGALGEYNGKFMSGQMVLKGGSCATTKNHIRNTYRNFFPPASRWQFSGIRLGRDEK